MRGWLLSAAAALGLALAPVGAKAAPNLDLAIKIQGNTYYDNGANDDDPTLGKMVLNLTVGTIELTGGTTATGYPLSGTPYAPEFRFRGGGLVQGGSNDQQVTIQYSQRNYTTTGPSLAYLTASSDFPTNVAGTKKPIARYDFYLDNSNVLFGHDTYLGRIRLASNSDTVNSKAGDLLDLNTVVDGSFSLTGLLFLNNYDPNRTISTGGGITLLAVPEPASLMLLGAGLLGLGAVRRRLR